MVNYVERSCRKENFILVNSVEIVDLFVDPNDYAGVIRAVNDLKLDIDCVTGIIPEIKFLVEYNVKNAVIIGTIGKNAVIDQCIREGKLDARNIANKWESFVIQTVPNPVEGIEQSLIIAGSDKRGTIYGIYDLSEKIGVSPWYWWADVKPQRCSILTVKPGIYKQGEPSVKYRGIFLNDEAPALTEWVKEKFGNYNHDFYEKIFELLLRLKANYLWPAMWNNAFNEDDEINPKLADMYGIVMGTSHHEPMLRAQQEWKIHGKGPWDYAKNAEELYEFWDDGIKRNREYESIITVGMRGDGDEPMGGSLTFDEKVHLLEKVVEDQRRIIAERIDSNPENVPQLWALYKEVQHYYEKGMRIPDDVTLLWSDDNHGNLRRVPTDEERKRSGGAGIYYHLDYVGGPRSYKWINTVPITKIWEQMYKAYTFGADRIWIVNVGDLKPMEFPTEFFLRMAWDVNQWDKDHLQEYTVQWAKKQFGSPHAKDIAYILSKYSKYNGRRKPELLKADLFSLVHYKEAERILAEFHEITTMAEKLYDEITDSLKDAYFELVLYPAKASSIVNELYITAGRNHLYAKQGRAMTNILAQRVKVLFDADAELTDIYNHRMANGKWNHMMDQTHIGYTYWNQPPQNNMPELHILSLEDGAMMGVGVEGSEEVWPDSGQFCRLPQFNNFSKKKYYFDVFNRKKGILSYTVKASEPWIMLSSSGESIEFESRIWVDIDWSKVPQGSSIAGSIYVNDKENTRVSIHVDVFNMTHSLRIPVKGFVESNGYIAVEAEHYVYNQEHNGLKWDVISDYGRTLSSMAVFPVINDVIFSPEQAPTLEYLVTLFTTGEIKVIVLIAPSVNFIPGHRLRLGIAFDDEVPRTGDGIPETENGSCMDFDWEESVRNNIRVIRTQHNISKQGVHVLKINMIDPEVVIQKIIIDTGGLQTSYLGPKESCFR